MKLYKVKTKLDAHSWMHEKPDPFIKDSFFALADDDDVKDYIEKYFGAWYFTEILEITEVEQESVIVSYKLRKLDTEEIRSKLTIAITSIKELANNLLN